MPTKPEKNKFQEKTTKSAFAQVLSKCFLNQKIFGHLAIGLSQTGHLPWPEKNDSEEDTIERRGVQRQGLAQEVRNLRG